MCDAHGGVQRPSSGLTGRPRAISAAGFPCPNPQLPSRRVKSRGPDTPGPHSPLECADGKLIGGGAKILRGRGSLCAGPGDPGGGAAGGVWGLVEGSECVGRVGEASGLCGRGF